MVIKFIKVYFQSMMSLVSNLIGAANFSVTGIKIETGIKPIKLIFKEDGHAHLILLLYEIFIVTVVDGE